LKSESDTDRNRLISKGHPTSSSSVLPTKLCSTSCVFVLIGGLSHYNLHKSSFVLTDLFADVFDTFYTFTFCF